MLAHDAKHVEIDFANIVSGLFRHNENKSQFDVVWKLKFRTAEPEIVHIIRL
jgi:hypothetical protein